MKYFSASTNGFYDPQINSIIPPDAVLVSDEDYSVLFSIAPQDKIIRPNANGYPVLVDNV